MLARIIPDSKFVRKQENLEKLLPWKARITSNKDDFFETVKIHLVEQGQVVVDGVVLLII